ncbi:hypothetical protein L486_04940 [Kwoniella mangroviensis CBS 10435]|uniref:FAD-binding FR-type domain-containing protein n=1 Tax=Kwoniella mangroviensis CBS 10435 TaxID=1331196 RepID=A0A1B9IPM7_9TREE|nr:hypothetical protein L486_04940 [Kwoniella mangroviensis CBS 10435]
MFSRSLILLWLTLLVIPSSADQLKISLKQPSHQCVEGCYDALSLLTFGDIKAKKPAMKDQCNSTSFVNSMALCSSNYCTEKQQVAGWEYITAECKDSKTHLEAQDVLLANIDESAVQSVDVFGKSKKYNGTVLLDQRSFNAGYMTIISEWKKQAYSHAFGFTIYLFLILAVFIGLFNRLLSFSVHRHIATSPEEANIPNTRGSSSRLSRGYTWWRKKVTTPALFGYRHSQPWGWVSIPTRLQSILIFLFLAINVIFTCVGYDLFDDDTEDTNDKQSQLLVQLQYRTGVMCVYNLPLLWMLAGRNDVVLWLTGWSYSSVNLWHRYIARLAVIQAFIHGICYTIDKRNDLTDRFLHRMYWTTGIFALICFILLATLSIKPIRTRWYEIFLITHIALALCSLVLLYFHLTHMKGKYNPYVWACVAVWCLDRVIRLLRIIVLTYKALSQKGKNTIAVMSNNDSGLIRLSITTSIRIIPKPGHYYFLYHPFSIKPWENHPFTVASWEINDSSTTLHFLVAPQKGATKNWRKRVSKTPNRTDSIRLLLEGPYGHTNPVERYESLLLVAGGSGITSMLAYIHTLKHHRDDLKDVRTKSVTLVWVVKSLHYAMDVLRNELKEFTDNSKGIEGISVKIQLHLTKDIDSTTSTLVGSPIMSRDNSKSTVGSSPNTSEEKINDQDGSKEAEGGSNTGLKIYHGRPEMQHLVDTALSRLVGGERLAVSACGPAVMIDDMRKAVCELYGLEEGKADGRTLEYFEELFSW